MTTPSSVFDYDMNTQEKTLLKQQKIVGVYDESNYESKRIWVEARDGEQVPMSMVYKKTNELEIPQNAPLLLYAYGSYGHS
jgi:oligopeptidase B